MTTVADLKPGDVVRFPFAGVRTVADVQKSGYRSIVGNRPIWYVHFVPQPGEPYDRRPGASVNDIEPIEIVSV